MRDDFLKDILDEHSLSDETEVAAKRQTKEPSNRGGLFDMDNDLRAEVRQEPLPQSEWCEGSDPAGFRIGNKVRMPNGEIPMAFPRPRMESPGAPARWEQWDTYLQDESQWLTAAYRLENVIQYAVYRHRKNEVCERLYEHDYRQDWDALCRLWLERGMTTPTEKELLRLGGIKT